MPASLPYAGRDLEAMGFAHRYHAWILDAFGGAVHGDVAEVGAGTGGFSECLRTRASTLTLFEPSEAMRARLPPGLLADPAVTSLPGVLADHAAALRRAFDAICYVNVLEHIQDDAGELALAHSVLRPGGRLCVFVPALPALMSDFDRSIGHLRRYRRDPLRMLAIEAGFEVETLRWFDLPGVLPWLIAMKWLRGGLNPRAVALYDRLVVPIARRVESVVPPPLGKSLLMVARRPS